MEKTRYTEYAEQIEAGSIIVQVPDDEDMPVQIIINTGKTLMMKLLEFEEICRAVASALAESGRKSTI